MVVFIETYRRNWFSPGLSPIVNQYWFSGELCGMPTNYPNAW